MLLRHSIPCLLAVAMLAHASGGLAGTNNVDLSTTLELVEPAPVIAGGEFQLLWVISNNSDNISSQALGSLALDPEAQFVGASCPSTFDAGTLVWTPPSVDNASPRQCVVSLRSEVSPPATLSFVATVDTSPQDSDTDSSNNSDTEEVNIVQASVDLSTTLEQVDPAPVVAGGNFQLRWVISNHAVNASSQALGSLALDPEAQFVGASCPSTFDAGTLDWTPPSVDSASPRQCVVSLRSEATPPATLSFVATVDTSVQDSDSDLSNNSDAEQISIVQGAATPTELHAGGLGAILALCLGLMLVARSRLRRLVSGLGRA